MNATIRSLIRDSFDDGDKWGSIMAHRFTIADALNREGGEIPHAWEYRAGLFAGDEPDPDDWHAVEYAEAIEAGEFTLDELTHAGNVLRRYGDALERAGHSY
jgi:hypothetical protein